MRVTAPRPGACSIQDDSAAFELTVETPILPANNDWILPAALPLAMALGTAVEFEPSLSPRMLRSVSTIQEILRGFSDGRLKPVAVSARPGADSGHSNGNVGLFFSGGVDSFYALLKNQDTVTHLVLVHGFDIRLDQTELFSLAEAAARKVAADFGKQLIVVRTNVRAISDRYVAWGMYHGAALAMVGHALSPLFSQCIIASSYPYGDLHPWGSHPLLDPLWSSERVRFVQEGLEANRIEKLTAIADNESVRSALRVCWESELELNCGRCEKCLRNMAILLALGKLDGFSTLPHRVDPALIRRLQLNKDSSIRNWSALEHDPRLPREIRRAISHSMNSYRLGLWPIAGYKRMKSYLRNVARLTRAMLPGA